MSFKFLYIDQNIEKANLEEYFKELNKFDNEKVLIDSGLEANLELAEHLFKELDYVSSIDAGIEDSSGSDKKKISFMTIIRIIIRLVKVIIRIIGVAGINIFKLILGKVTGYVNVARKLNKNIAEYMDKNGISDNECKYDVKRDDIVLTDSSLIDACLCVTKDYKRGIYGALEEFLFIEKYIDYVTNITKLLKTFDVYKDVDTVNKIITEKGVVTKEIVVILRKYAVDSYRVFSKKPISPVLDRYLLDNLDRFEIVSFSSKKKRIRREELASFFVEGYHRSYKENIKGVLRVNLIVYDRNNDEELERIVNKTESEIPFIRDVFSLSTAEMSIKEELPKPKVFTIKEIEDIINKVDSKAKLAEKFTSTLKKMHKELTRFEEELEKLDTKTIANTKISRMLLSYLASNVRTYVKISKFIVSHIGNDIGMGIPNNLLVEITFGKGVCVGYIDPNEIDIALKEEENKIKKELNKN